MHNFIILLLLYIFIKCCLFTDIWIVTTNTLLFTAQTVQKVTADYEVLLKDHEDVKKKLEAAKARNKSLSAEIKTLKVQISTLLEKGKHDDELVDALLVRTWLIKSVDIYKNMLDLCSCPEI